MGSFDYPIGKEDEISVPVKTTRYYTHMKCENCDISELFFNPTAAPLEEEQKRKKGMDALAEQCTCGEIEEDIVKSLNDCSKCKENPAVEYVGGLMFCPDCCAEVKEHLYG